MSFKYIPVFKYECRKMLDFIFFIQNISQNLDKYDEMYYFCKYKLNKKILKTRSQVFPHMTCQNS